MRLALSSLLLAAGLATAAHAQEPAAQPAPAQPAPAQPAPAQPAPAQPATAQPAPAAPAPASTTPPTTEAAPPAATPAAPPAEAPPPAPTLPTLPTSGNGAETISVLEKVCVPAVKGGQKLEDLAKANGFKLNRRDQTWAKQLGAENKAYQVILFPMGSNKGVCNAELRYAMGQDAEISKALNVWAFVHQPPLEPTANYTQPQDPDGLKRVRRSWEYLTATDSIGLNFSTVRRPDDSPLNAKFDTATLQYQERKF